MSDNELLYAISDMMDVKLEPINSRLDKMEQTLADDILPRMDNLEQSQKKIEQSQRKIELTLENNISPRLQTIEDCYLSTFERYQSGVGQLEKMQGDINVIKTTIINHSEKLQRLA